MIPLVSISVVRLECVVEVVVAFSKCQECQPERIPARIFFRVRLRTPYVGRTVDQESTVMNEDNSG